MNQNEPARTARMLLASLALLALVAGLAVTLTQCKMVNDGLGAVRVDQSANAATCIAACAHQFNDSIRVESDLHVANVHACSGDTLCLAAEEARHDAAVDRIQAGRRACQDNCHHQGGGSGGR